MYELLFRVGEGIATIPSDMGLQVNPHRKTSATWYKGLRHFSAAKLQFVLGTRPLFSVFEMESCLC